MTRSSTDKIVEGEWKDLKEGQFIILTSDVSVLLALNVQQRMEDDSCQSIEAKVRVYRDDLGFEEAKALMEGLKPQIVALCRAMGGVID